MKKLLISLMFLLPVSVFAEGYPLAQLRRVYSSSNVTTSAWSLLFTAVAGPISTIEIFDSSGQTLEIGTGAPGSEVVKAIVPPGGNGPIRFYVPTGQNISIKALSANATVGELDINLYN